MANYNSRFGAQDYAMASRLALKFRCLKTGECLSGVARVIRKENRSGGEPESVQDGG